MGRQRDSKLVGTIGNLIFYNHRGDYRMRTKPDYVKRTAATVRSGLNFGKASKISLQIRKLVAHIKPQNSDEPLSSRLTGAVNKFIGWKEKQDPAVLSRQNELPFIQGFQFNSQSDLASISAIQVSLNSTEPGKIEIHFKPFVPSEALHAPFNTNHILFKMVLTETDLGDVETRKLGEAEIKIPYNDEMFQPQVISIPAISKSGRIVLLIMAVQYMVNRKDKVEMLIDLKKQPCGVVWSGLI